MLDGVRLMLIRAVWAGVGLSIGMVAHHLVDRHEYDDAIAGWQECISIAYAYHMHAVRFRVGLGVWNGVHDNNFVSVDHTIGPMGGTEY